MQLNRNIDISIYNFFNDNLPDMIEVLDGYPTGYNGNPREELNLPTVAILDSGMQFSPHQLAGDDLKNFVYIIDVYGLTKTQKTEIVYRIHELLNNRSIPIYDHSAGFPSDTLIGSLVIEGTVMSGPLYVFPKLTEKMFWAEELTFRGYYSPVAS